MHGGYTMIYNGYSYVREYYSNLFTHWKCAVGCDAWIKTLTLSNTFFRGVVTHSHFPNPPIVAKKIQHRRMSTLISADPPNVKKMPTIKKSSEKNLLAINTVQLSNLIESLIELVRKPIMVDKAINTYVAWKTLVEAKPCCPQRCVSTSTLKTTMRDATCVRNLKDSSTTIQQLITNRVIVQDNDAVSAVNEVNQIQSPTIKYNTQPQDKNKETIIFQASEIEKEKQQADVHKSKLDRTEKYRQKFIDKAIKSNQTHKITEMNISSKKDLLQPQKEMKETFKTNLNSVTVMKKRSHSQSDEIDLRKKIRFCVPQKANKNDTLDKIEDPHNKIAKKKESQTNQYTNTYKMKRSYSQSDEIDLRRKIYPSVFHKVKETSSLSENEHSKKFGQLAEPSYIKMPLKPMQKAIKHNEEIRCPAQEAEKSLPVVQIAKDIHEKVENIKKRKEQEKNAISNISMSLKLFEEATAHLPPIHKESRIVQSMHGGYTMVYNGYSYVREHYSNLFTHWKCAVGCNAWIKTRTPSNIFFRGFETHSHFPDTPIIAKKIQHRRASTFIPSDALNVVKTIPNNNKIPDKKSFDKSTEPLPLVELKSTRKTIIVGKRINTYESWKKPAEAKSRLTQRYLRVSTPSLKPSGRAATNMRKRKDQVTQQKLIKKRFAIKENKVVSATTNETKIEDKTKETITITISEMEKEECQADYQKHKSDKSENKRKKSVDKVSTSLKNTQIKNASVTLKVDDNKDRPQTKGETKGTLRTSSDSTKISSNTGIVKKKRSLSQSNETEFKKKVRFCIPQEADKTNSFDKSVDSFSKVAKKKELQIHQETNTSKMKKSHRKKNSDEEDLNKIRSSVSHKVNKTNSLNKYDDPQTKKEKKNELKTNLESKTNKMKRSNTQSDKTELTKICAPLSQKVSKVNIIPDNEQSQMNELSRIELPPIPQPTQSNKNVAGTSQADTTQTSLQAARIDEELNYIEIIDVDDEEDIATVTIENIPMPLTSFEEATSHLPPLPKDYL